MRRAAAAVTGALALACAGASAPPAPVPHDEGRVVDLTHVFDAETIFWPTEEGFVLERGSEGMTDAGYYYAAHRFRSAEHGGTHIDAPIHFHEGRWTTDQIPLERLIGRAVSVDVSEACAADPDHRIGVAELERWEAEHGAIPSGAIVLLRTGFGSRWPDRKRYLGTDERGAAAVAELHFPGLDPDAARWLVAERDVHAVGIDTASIDPGQSRDFMSHRILFAANVPAFENVARLEVLPARGFRVVALPMKIGGGSGGPLRIVAILP